MVYDLTRYHTLKNYGSNFYCLILSIRSNTCLVHKVRDTHNSFAYSNLIVCLVSAMRLTKRKLIVETNNQSSVVAVFNIRGLSQ